MRNKKLLSGLACTLVFVSCVKEQNKDNNVDNAGGKDFYSVEQVGVYTLRQGKASPVFAFEDESSQYISSTSKRDNVRYLFRAIDLTHSGYMSVGLDITKANIKEGEDAAAAVEYAVNGNYETAEQTLFVSHVDEELKLVWLEDYNSNAAYIISK